MRRACRIIASILGLLFSAMAGPSSATIVTFGFEGPVGTSPRSLGTYIRGQITYDTDTASQNEASPGEHGDALRYEGAVLSITFATENISRRYDFGTVQLWNDYASDPDWIRFIVDWEDPLQELVITGRDRNFLASGALPEHIPTEGIERVDLFWNETSDDEVFELVSNSLRIIPAAIPEPDSVGLFIAALLGFGTGCWLRQTRSQIEGFGRASAIA